MKKTRKSTRILKRPVRRRTANALRILDRITGNDTALHELIEEATVNAKVAEMLHRARRKAGLTQAQLAERIGTSQSVIARLEDADYEGHSLTMLQRIAVAIGQRLEIRFSPNPDMHPA